MTNYKELIERLYKNHKRTLLLSRRRNERTRFLLLRRTEGR